MNIGDRVLQRWRIRKARRYLAGRRRVLDIGCADGALLRQMSDVSDYVGIDPELRCSQVLGNGILIKGHFPEDLPDNRKFDAITMLATLEHVPRPEHAKLAQQCADLLKPGGRLVLTIPSPGADRALRVLRTLRVIDGMALQEHYGLDVNEVLSVFPAHRFSLVVRKRFELGFNNLLVFERQRTEGDS